MNELYLTFFGIVTIHTVCHWIVVLFQYGKATSNYQDASLIFGSIAFLILLLLSGVLPMGDEFSVTKPATNTRVGDELVIQSDGFPTQVITDIRFIDKPVSITKTISRNSWGGDLDTVYTITLETPENP